MRELEASLAALQHAVDVYVARRLGRRFPHPGAAQPSRARASSPARPEAVPQWRDRVAAWLHAMAAKALGGRH